MSEAIKLSEDLGFLRVGAFVPATRVADIDANVHAIVEAMKQGHEKGVQVMAFPELAITGYTVQDLVLQQALLSKARSGLTRILTESTGHPMLVIVGIWYLLQAYILPKMGVST